MSKRTKQQLLVLLLLPLATGCGASTLVSSSENKAYVVSGNIFGSDVYHCTADDEGNPTCLRVMEVD